VPKSKTESVTRAKTKATVTAQSGTPIKRRGGRQKSIPTTPENLKSIVGLGRLHASFRECASFFKVALQTWEDMMKDPVVKAAYQQGEGEGKMTLRRLQFKLAESNPAMAIFLGKNLLAQKDRFEQHNTFDFSNLTDEELIIAQKMLARKALETSNTGAGNGGQTQTVN